MKRIICAFVLMLLANAASAQHIDNSGVLESVSNQFATESAGWMISIQGYATWLFMTLASISMAWTFCMMILRKADIGDYFAEFIRFGMFSTFFYWLLRNGPRFAITIINSFRVIGSKAANIDTVVTSSTPIDIAFEIINRASKSYDLFKPIDNLAINITLMIILACMGIVAANFLLTMIGAWIIAFAGVFVLGFGGSRWTSDIAIGYFKTVVSISLKLMTMTLMIGVANSIMQGFYEKLDEGADYTDLLVIFVVSLVLAILIHSVPNLIAGLVPSSGGASGIGSFSGTQIAASASSLGSAASSTAKLAAAGAGAAIATAGSAAANTTGGIKAFSAAVGAAKASNGKAGTLGSSGSGNMLGSGKGAQQANTSPGGSGGPNFAQAAGIGGASSARAFKQASSQGGGGVGRIAAGTVKNLAKGAFAVGHQKYQGMKAAANARIDKTVGGQVAQAIQKQNKGSGS